MELLRTSIISSLFFSLSLLLSRLSQISMETFTFNGAARSNSDKKSASLDISRFTPFSISSQSHSRVTGTLARLTTCKARERDRDCRNKIEISCRNYSFREVNDERSRRSSTVEKLSRERRKNEDDK